MIDTPNPPQAAVPEALRLAEEAKRCAELYASAVAGQQSTGLVSHRTLVGRGAALYRAIDRLAALVQPPEAPAAKVLFRQDEDGLEPVMFYGPGAEPDPSTLKDRFVIRDVWLAPPARPEAPAAVEVSRLIQDARELVDRGLPKWLLTRRSVMEKLDEISLATMAPTPASDSAAETALRMAVERHMTCRFYFGSTVAQATVPGGPAVYETVENHADPLAGACQAIAQAAAKIDAGIPAPQVPSEAARLVGGEAAIGFSPMWMAPIDGTPVLLYLPTSGAKFAVGQFWEFTISESFWGDEESVPFTHRPAGWMGLHVLERLASGQAAPTDAPGEPDDLLTVAHVTTDGGGILTMLAASLGDLIDIVGDEPETYSISIATMKRAEFEALGEFDGF